MREELLLLLSFAVRTGVGQECGGQQIMHMQEKFQNCAYNQTLHYEQYRSSYFDLVSIQAAVCNLLSGTVDSCGKIWRSCHPEDEVTRLKDMQLESMMSQYSVELGGNPVNSNCHIIAQYIKSGRREQNRKIGSCSDYDFADAQKKYQHCSHVQSLKAYDRIQELDRGSSTYPKDGQPQAEEASTSLEMLQPETESEKTLDILCSTLRYIASVCVSFLQECFSEDDITQMKGSHLDGIRDYLVKIARGGVTDREIEKCDISKVNISIGWAPDPEPTLSIVHDGKDSEWQAVSEVGAPKEEIDEGRNGGSQIIPVSEASTAEVEPERPVTTNAPRHTKERGERQHSLKHVTQASASQRPERLQHLFVVILLVRVLLL